MLRTLWKVNRYRVGSMAGNWPVACGVLGGALAQTGGRPGSGEPAAGRGLGNRRPAGVWGAT
jgi:hypothetical protein